MEWCLKEVSLLNVWRSFCESSKLFSFLLETSLVCCFIHKCLGALQEGCHTFRGGFWNYFSMGKSSSLGVLSNILSLNLHSYLILSRKCLLLLSRFKFHHCHLFVVIFKISILSSFFLYISQIIVDNIFLNCVFWNGLHVYGCRDGCSSIICISYWAKAASRKV